MLRPTLVVCAVLALAAPAFADDSPASSLPAHGRALDFSLQGATLAPLDGTTISYRCQKSASAWWRYGITLSVNQDHRDGDGIDDSAPLNPKFETTSKFDQSEYGLSISRLTTPAPAATIKPYLGLGLEGGWRDARSDTHRNYFDPAGALAERNDIGNHTWGPWGGVFLILGAEWAVNPHIAMHAEYGQGVQYSAGQYEDTWYSFYTGSPAVQRNENGHQKVWTFDSRGAHAGVSIFY